VKTSQINCSNIPADSPVDVEADCDWEEHGEPRKTILSSIKPRTDKPMIASLLLISIFIIAIASAFFPTFYLQAPVQVAELTGVNGGLTITLDNESLVDADYISLSINQENIVFERNNNSFHASSLNLGEHVLSITYSTTDTTTTKEVYILPFDLSSHTIKIIDTTPLTIENDSYELEWLSSILIILAAITLIGAIMCWKRKYSDVAVISSLVGICTIGIYFSGLILGIIAIWLILKSRDEFDDGKKGKSF
jgi:hypothetical protein